MTTLAKQVAASADDGWQNAAGTVAITGNDIGGLSGPNFWAGWRFQNVTIDQGQVLTSAVFEGYAYDTSEDNVWGNFHCEDVDNATAFAASSNNISGRTLTDAFTAVGVSNVGVGWYAVDITPACQEVIDRGGWANGNAMNVIMDCLLNSLLRFRQYDYSDGSFAAKLTFEYSAGGLAVPVKTMFYATATRAA